MAPMSLTDHPATRRMMGYFRPEYDVPSRKTLTRDIKNLGVKAKTDLTNLLHGIQVVATTADSWTAHNRAFVGMTVHWIDPATLERKSAVLACKEVKVGNFNLKIT